MEPLQKVQGPLGLQIAQTGTVFSPQDHKKGLSVAAGDSTVAGVGGIFTYKCLLIGRAKTVPTTARKVLNGNHIRQVPKNLTGLLGGKA